MRYAYGGDPLWIREPDEVKSTPIRPAKGASKKQPGANHHRGAAAADSIPRCASCGAERCFELQFMPALSRYIAYDSVLGDGSRDTERQVAPKQANSASAPSGAPPPFSDETAEGVDLLQLHMGVLAIWSCAESCAAGSTEYCVFQPAI